MRPDATVPASLAPTAVHPGDPAYRNVRSTYVWPGEPGLVLRPRTPEQVAEAVTFAAARGGPFSVRSGGHGINGRSTNDGGTVVDLGALDTVEVLDRDRRLVRLGAGARWGDVAATLTPLGLAISSGDHGGVGVGGLATSGGHGFLARSYGLTVDRVVGADVVLADGTLVRADAGHHPDLFWAVRGAGGAMGVVTSFDIEAAEVGNVVIAVLVHHVTDTPRFLAEWGALVEGAPRALTPWLILTPGRPTAAQSILVWAGDGTDAAVEAIQPFADLTPLRGQQAQLAPYPALLIPHGGPHTSSAPMRSHSALLDHLDGPAPAGLAAMLDDGDVGIIAVRSVGGAVNDLAADATAYAHRTQNFSVAAIVREQRRERAAARWTALGATALYAAFESHPDDAALTRAFPPATLARLRSVKAAYDPGGLFRTTFPL
ncbi:FAD-binding oxidoreductase [Actinomadura flavalba]|uniref:FAD-binding oxidoreductase n=1 Tax=Actinomadura flavalba TaxID=1120938 RepID=UPI00036DF5FF|nr:FAD-binding oxidoreductase [Actinomadura flavalba]